MSFKNFLLSRIFLKNLLFAIAITALIIIITMWSLKIYTRHGQAYPLPDLKGMGEIELKEAAKEYKFKYLVIDSIFINDVEGGSIVDQIPEPGFKVKENRTVFLTINAHSPEKVILPKLRDISFRQATVVIENSGLIVGKIIYRPSEYDNLVLDVLIDSTNVYEGDKYPKTSEIDLIVGKISVNEKAMVPDVIGLDLTKAKSVITDAMINMGVVIYDETILTGSDTLNAKIFRQRPDSKINSKIDLGTSIDLWLTIDKLKISDAY